MKVMLNCLITFMLISLCIPKLAMSDLNDGLIAYFPFNGNSNDMSDNRNDCVNHGATLTEDRFGNINSAYNFNGSSDYMDKLNPNLFPEGDNPRTISAWIMSTGTTELYQTIISYGTCSTNKYFGIERGGYSGKGSFEKIQVQGWNNNFFGTSIIEFHKWYHIVITYDQTNLAIYVNSKAEATTTKSFNTVLNSSYGLRIGLSPPNDGWHGHFKGVVDDIRIYNRAISESEVLELYNEPNPNGIGSVNLCDHLDWKQFEGCEYALTENFGTWYEAQIEANRCGGNLVIINDDEKNSWLSNEFSNTYNRSHPGEEYQAIAWIGYFLNSQTENWEWVNGEPVSYVNEILNHFDNGKFAYLLLNPHPSSPMWGNNPIHNSDYGYNPKGIIERTFSGCISQERYCQVIEAERLKWDVNNDKKIGLEEAIYALQISSGLSNLQPSNILTEICNDFDDDCDGEIDEGVKIIFYRDADNDSYGDINNPIYACKKPLGYVSNSDDCNDSDINIHPDATETCNGKDDNCNNKTDEDLPIITYCQDLDADSYGNPNKKQQACKQPSCYVDNCDDCNDSDKNVHPGATEICNGKDDNCDGKLKEVDIVRYWSGINYDNYTTSGAVNVESIYNFPRNLGKALCEPDGDKTVPIYSCEIHYPKSILPDPFNNPEVHSQFTNGKTERYLRTDCSLGVNTDYNPKTLNNGKPIFYLYKNPGAGRKLIRACFIPFQADTFETDTLSCQADCTTELFNTCKEEYNHSDWVCTCDDVGNDLWFLGYTSGE